MTFDLATVSTAMSAQPKKSNNNRPVVATPTGGGRSFAKFQKGTAFTPTNTNKPQPRAATPGRDRGSKSPGRSRSRSRDIVQEVYDRMGVNYKRGHSSFELDDNKSTISIHSGTKSVTKSPSRNRFNNQMQAANDSDARSVKSSILTGVARRWSSTRSVTSKSSSRPVVVYPSKKDTAPRYEYNNSNTTAPSNREDGSFPTTERKQQPSLEVNTRDDIAEDREVEVVCEDARDDSEERRDGPPAEVIEEPDSGRTSPLSVKSRISAFSGYNGGRNSFHSSSKRASGTSWSYDASGNIVKPVNRYKEAKSSLANSYMAAINGGKSSSNPPVTKPLVTRHKSQPSDFSITSIPVQKLPSDADADDHSVAASEISAEDFTAAASKRDTSRAVVTGKSKSTAAPTLTKDMIDQMIEEKIQAKFAELQIQMESQLKVVEEKANERLDNMEKKLDSLTNTGSDEQKTPNTPSTPQSPVVQPIYLRSPRW